MNGKDSISLQYREVTLYNKSLPQCDDFETETTAYQP